MAKYADSESIGKKLVQPRVIPKCWHFMQPEFVEYVEGESLTLEFPVLEVYSNPRGTMQGGFMTAAFDNTFGALLQMETRRRDMASIDIHMNFQRPIFVGDILVVRAQVKTIGQTLAHLYGEGFDKSQGRLTATAVSNLMLMGQEKFARKEDGPQSE
ncbi:MAG: PaaI family thioesterase [Syntrophomonadaceae bacterium]